MKVLWAFFILSITLIPPLLAQQQSQTDLKQEIRNFKSQLTDFGKQLQALEANSLPKDEHIALLQKYMELQTKLVQKEGEHIADELKAENSENFDRKSSYFLGIFGALVAIISAVLFGLIKYWVNSTTEKRIDQAEKKFKEDVAGNAELFDSALEKIKELDRIKGDVNQNLTEAMIWGGVPGDDIDKYVSASDLLKVALSGRSRHLRLQAAFYLGAEQYPDVVKPLTEKYLNLTEDTDLTVQAISTLGKIGTEEAYGRSIDFLKLVFESKTASTNLPESQQEKRKDYFVAIVTALSETKSRKHNQALRPAVEILESALLDEPELFRGEDNMHGIATFAFGIITYVGGIEAEEALKAIFHQSEEPEIWSHCVDAFNNLVGSIAVAAEVERMMEPREHQLTSRVKDILKSQNDEVRKKLFPYLDRIGTRGIPPLFRILRDEELHPFSRCQAAITLRHLAQDHRQGKKMVGDRIMKISSEMLEAMRNELSIASKDSHHEVQVHATEALSEVERAMEDND